jgi:hypothetical protein
MSLNPEATGDFEGIIVLRWNTADRGTYFTVAKGRVTTHQEVDFYAARDRRGVVMITGAVRRFENLQPGAWFYFSRLGAAGVALKVIDKMVRQ